MVPTYVPGERLTVFRHWRKVRGGDVVLFAILATKIRWLLKRCVSVQGHQLDLRGDNPDASTDSRDFGLVSEPQRQMDRVVTKSQAMTEFCPS